MNIRCDIVIISSRCIHGVVPPVAGVVPPVAGVVPPVAGVVAGMVAPVAGMVPPVAGILACRKHVHGKGMSRRGPLDPWVPWAPAWASLDS